VLVLASTVVLISDPVGTHDQIFVRPKTIYVPGNRAFSWKRGGVGLSV
jgi:hypothetical protein